MGKWWIDIWAQNDLAADAPQNPKKQTRGIAIDRMSVRRDRTWDMLVVCLALCRVALPLSRSSIVA